MASRNTPLLFIALLGLSLFTARPGHAQSILIAPGSLLLTDAQRTGEINIANSEERRISYRVEPALFRMRSDGFLEEVETLALSAASMIRFAPRQFELDPGGSQVVRVAFRASADLPPGEYRLHLRMRNMGAPIAAQDAAASAETAVVAGQISLQIPVTVARAARILVRHGVGPGHVGLDPIQVRRTAPDMAQVDLALLNRHDGGSANGTLLFELNGRMPQAGEKGMRRRYSVYADLDRRDYQVVLPVPVGQPTEVCVSLIPDGSAPGAAPIDRHCGSA
jgi:hypothetical protein